MSVLAPSTPVTERESVIDYLWARIRVAFGAAEDQEEVNNLFRFVTRLEQMTDAEYEDLYCADGHP